METPVTAAPAREQSSGALTYALVGAVALVAIVFAFSSSAFLPNNWYSLFKAIHVTFAVVWVGGGTLLTILGIIAERKNDPAEIAIVARQAAMVGEKLFAPAGLVVLAMGIAMLINTDLGWGKFWVIVGLLGYASTFVTGLAVLSPLAKKVTASVSERGPEHPETIALIKRILFVARIDIAVLLVVILDMVTKPFS